MWHGKPMDCRPRGPDGHKESWERWGQRFAERWADAQERGARGGGRQRRMFDGGELRLVLLRLIADEARHGYELIRAIETMTGGAYAPSPGVVYPTLTLLDEMGLIAEQRSDDSKKRFAVTAEGRAHLAERADEVARLIARLTELGEHRQRHGASPVARAMRNLGMVVRNRAEMADDAGPDAMHEIAAMIDELAQRIERLK